MWGGGVIPKSKIVAWGIFISFRNIDKKLFIFLEFFFGRWCRPPLPGALPFSHFPLLKFCNHSLIFSIAKLTSVRYHVLRAPALS